MRVSFTLDDALMRVGSELKPRSGQRTGGLNRRSTSQSAFAWRTQRRAKLTCSPRLGAVRSEAACVFVLRVEFPSRNYTRLAFRSLSEGPLSSAKQTVLVSHGQPFTLLLLLSEL